MSQFVWREVTRNCHIAYLGDAPVIVVSRPQKLRHESGKRDWDVKVLDKRSWNKTFVQHDPRDLGSTKSAAEARAKSAIEWLHKKLHEKDPRS